MQLCYLLTVVRARYSHQQTAGTHVVDVVDLMCYLLAVVRARYSHQQTAGTHAVDVVDLEQRHEHGHVLAGRFLRRSDEEQRVGTYLNTLES